jgi:hypothetical protein
MHSAAIDLGTRDMRAMMHRRRAAAYPKHRGWTLLRDSFYEAPQRSEM